MKTISVEFARALIDFAPTAKAREQGYGESQLHGAVAAFNMLARNSVAYLADEVGMGKTYVALGVVGLLRHLQPTARVMVIAPSENIQRKWVKELLNFVRENWQLEDNRVKGLDGRPVFDPVVCGSIDELGATARINDDRDLFLRMTTFSLAIRSAEGRRRLRHRIQRLLPWVKTGLLSSSDPFVFRDAYGHMLNALLPDIDLLIIDEAHNFKHGYGLRVSNRNRVVGLALGHPTAGGPEYPWYGRRVKRALLLSATPFEYDYQDIYNQLDVMGLGALSLRNAAAKDPRRVSILRDPDVAEAEKRDVIRRLLLRRVSYLRIANEKYTKNRYRREWRQGGYGVHDRPMMLTDPKERLVVGLIQKKVAEILGDRRFNNQFQIGMLSSFESFLESMSRSRRRTLVKVEEDEEVEQVFDDRNQEATSTERQGIDTQALERVVTSYRKRFGKGLPHPKLDATAKALAHAFETGEKALIFSRRIATVGELKAKLDRFFDVWIRDRMVAALPGLEDEIAAIFDRYNEEQRQQSASRAGRDSSHPNVDQVEEDLLLPFEDDEGGTDSFFAWFYRGEGPDEMLSGAAFQRNRLSSTASVYSTVFEDDHVSWLLGRPSAPLGAFADALRRPRAQVLEELRQRAFGYFKRRTKQASGYPRFYVFEAYQVAALQMLAEASGEFASGAQIILNERHTLHDGTLVTPPKKFPQPEDGIGTVTFFTELVKRPALRAAIWPQSVEVDFRQRFIDQERRRELISAMARLGAPYIDLYLLAIRRLGGFKIRRQAEAQHPELQLIGDFLDLLEQQATQSGFHAFYELSSAAEAFDSIVAANFPEVHHSRLKDLPAVFGRSLQHQLPVGGMSGEVNKRLVRQFRMPGFPLVMISTDVLQQGEDLHTFCKKVIHYGITWTPSAMEQRTGRIDRIGGLVQRHLDGRDTPPNPDELIQVYLPHLQDTVEVFQVRRVLERLNKFLRLIHRTRPKDRAEDSKIDVAEELLRQSEPVPVIEGVLESAFPVQDEWLHGQLGKSAVVKQNTKEFESYLSDQWRTLLDRYAVKAALTGSRRRLSGIATLANGRLLRHDHVVDHEEVRSQPFELELTSQVLGSRTLLSCTSPIGHIDLDDPYNLDQLYDLQFDLGMVKVCAVHDVKKRTYDVTVRGERMFDLKTTQFNEVEQLVLSTVQNADRIEQELLWTDEEAGVWLGRTRRRVDA